MLTVYGVNASPFVRKVRVVLMEKNVPYELETVFCCGKSNVADAISWVIGEQRAKALRGSKMEDVIFQGSRSRQPAGMAEVSLTMVVHETFEIRGEAGALEAEKHAAEAAELASQAVEQAEAYQAEMNAEANGPETQATEVEASEQSSEEQATNPAADQAVQQAKKRRKIAAASAAKVFHEGERITVARRLYRTGESEYEMNGRSCRLRDVQDLFSGTGLGGAHYAIIEQGRIGQVLSAKPMDRRALIEELHERNDQSLFELCVRLMTGRGFDVSRQAVSKHIAVLEEAGPLSVRKLGRTNIHHLDTARFAEVIAWLTANTTTPTPEVRE